MLRVSITWSVTSAIHVMTSPREEVDSSSLDTANETWNQRQEFGLLWVGWIHSAKRRGLQIWATPPFRFCCAFSPSVADLVTGSRCFEAVRFRVLGWEPGSFANAIYLNGEGTRFGYIPGTQPLWNTWSELALVKIQDQGQQGQKYSIWGYICTPHWADSIYYKKFHQQIFW